MNVPRWQYRCTRVRPVVARSGTMASAATVLLVVFAIFASTQDTTTASATPRATAATTRAVPIPPELDLNVNLASVSCVDQSDCIAVGTFLPQGSGDFGALGAPAQPGEHAVVMRFNGRSWSNLSTPPIDGATLYGVSCESRKMCVAVGTHLNTTGSNSTLVEVMRGSSWSADVVPDASFFPSNSSFLHSVSCTTMNSCIAVGGDADFGAFRYFSYSPLIERFSGGAWTVVPLTTNRQIFFASVSCEFDTGCVAVGSSGGSNAKDGGVAGFREHEGTWTPAGDPPRVLNGVTCLLDGDCVGAGGSSQAYVAKLRGLTWHSLDPRSSGDQFSGLDSVSCSGTGSCVAVGWGEREVLHRTLGQPLIEVQSGDRWSHAVTRYQKGMPELFSVSCPDPSFCMAVGLSMDPTLSNPSLHPISMVVRH